MSSENFKVVLVDAKASASMDEKVEYNPLCVSAEMKAPDAPEEILEAQEEAEMQAITETNDIIFDTDEIDLDGEGVALFDMTWDDFKSRVEATEDKTNIYKLNTDNCSSVKFTSLRSESKYAFKLNTPADSVSNLEGVTSMEPLSNVYNVEFDNLFTVDGGNVSVNVDGEYKGSKAYSTDAEDVDVVVNGENRDDDPYGSDDAVAVNWSEDGVPKMTSIETSDMAITAMVLSLLSRHSDCEDPASGLEELNKMDVKKHLDENNVVNFPFYLVSMNESMDLRLPCHLRMAHLLS